MDRKPLLVSVLSVLWVAIVYGGYYTTHKPLDWAAVEKMKGGLARLGGLSQPPLYTGWIDAGTGMVGTAWALFLGLLIGLWILGRLGYLEPNSALAESLRPLERIALAMPLGLGAMALVVFFLGLGGLLYRWLFYALFALGTLILLPQLKALKGTWGSRPLGVLEKGLVGYLGVAFLLSFLTALAPPTGWDSLVYHLAAPKMYIENHRIVGGVDIPYFYFPPLMEMLFTAAVFLGGEISPRLLHLGFAFLGVLGVFSFCNRFWGGRTPWLAPAILLSAPSLLTLSSQAYVDWGLMVYTFLAFWAMIEGIKGRDLRWFALSGSFGGFALGVKYTGWVVFFALGALLLWQSWQGLRDGTQRRGVGGHALGLWLGAASLMAAPWYIKNLIFTGNPLYPFFFGGWNWDPWRAEWFSRFGTGLASAPGGPIRLLAAPWEMTVLGTEGTVFYDATIGPVFLAVLPLALLVKRNPMVNWAALVTLVGYAFWLYGASQSSLLIQTRLLFPIFPFLAVVAASAIEGLKELELPPPNLSQGPHVALSHGRVFFSLRRFILAALLLALFLSLISQGGRLLADSPFPFLSGRESRESYLARHLGGLYEVMEYINGNLGPQDKVLFLWEPRSYYCGVPCQPDPLLHNWRYALFRYGGPDGILAAWREAGYTHLLLNGRGLRYYSEPPHQEVEAPHLEALREIEQRHLKKLLGPGLEEEGELADEYTLYQILFSPFSP